MSLLELWGGCETADVTAENWAFLWAVHAFSEPYLQASIGFFVSIIPFSSILDNIFPLVFFFLKVIYTF